jgi:hypothetical protein
MARFDHPKARRALARAEAALLAQPPNPAVIALLAEVSFQTGLVHLREQNRGLALDSFRLVHRLQPAERAARSGALPAGRGQGVRRRPPGAGRQPPTSRSRAPSTASRSISTASASAPPRSVGHPRRSPPPGRGTPPATLPAARGSTQRPTTASPSISISPACPCRARARRAHEALDGGPPGRARCAAARRNVALIVPGVDAVLVVADGQPGGSPPRSTSGPAIA